MAQTGERRLTSDATRAALLGAMGLDAGDDAAARRTLADLAARDAGRLLAPAVVRPHATGGARRRRGEVVARVPRAWAATVEWSLTLVTEDGEEHRADGRARRRPSGEVALPLPSEPAIGYHTLHLTARSRGEERAATQRLIVTPTTCPAPFDVLGGERAFGLTTNLYSVRSARNWGVGDLTDLRALVAFAGGAGASFVGVNPLHALRNEGGEISPYSPVSRLFRNPLYLDVDAVPELADAPEVRQRLASGAFRQELARLRATTHVDYAAVMRLKRPVLEALHRVFAGARARGAGRARRYRGYVASQGAALTDFATFVALDEHFRARGVTSWREWPEELRTPGSAGVARFRRAHADAIDFHRWVQFELDEQLAAGAADARALGLSVGLYQDLAIGTSPSGSDVWSNPGLFLTGASVGAPPDPLAPQGQNWGLPPLNPVALAEQGYDFWTTLVRGALRHAGALRIDHVLGLFRQFWIPEGMSGDQGAYVRFPSEALLGIVALESVRAGALVVGEDLGTVPPEVPPALERWRLLSSRVLYFEREGGGAFRPPRAYPAMALATANTHDLATLAGFWRGRDVALRRELGLLASARAERTAQRERERDRRALVERLVAEGIVSPQAAADLDELTLRAAVHAFLRRTPSWLVGLSLDDLVGETEPVNVPGVGPDDFPGWSRRLAVPLETLAADRNVRRALGAERWAVSGEL